MSKSYEVTIPIAGLAYLTIIADSEEEAIEKGMEEASIDIVDNWEFLNAFIKGNVCYCPQPWEATAETDGEEIGKEPEAAS